VELLARIGDDLDKIQITVLKNTEVLKAFYGSNPALQSFMQKN
jgi:hypothetical protein